MTQNNQPGLRSDQRPLQTERSSEVLFVRHTAVAEKYQNVCYGASNVELSADGEQHARKVAETLAGQAIDRIVHSGLTRAKIIADHLAELTGLFPEQNDGLRERNFGDWELNPWEDIYREHGDDMMKMVSEPETFRPGGAETTREFIERVASACENLHLPGRTVVICHGGVIAALTGLSRRLSISEWLEQIPAHGEIRPLPPISLDHLSLVLQSGRA
ncbi:MAG: histidine phosphatase family protein [Planctomycetaceae bacterium]|nr:histidine phosphatase family protein [Planctomycetaceae bacterium]